MLKKFGFILSLFIFCKSLDIISISNSGKKEIHFTKKKKYFVFEYKNSEGGNYSKVNIIKSQENNRSHYVYIYLNKSNIDEKFSNYYSKGNFDNSIYSIDINEPLKNKFYIVISQSNEIEQNNVTINIYSSDNFYNAEGYKGNEINRKMGVMAVEMEAAALYANAAASGKRALCICTVSDSFVYPEENTTAEERQNSFTAMMEVALEIA